MSSKYNCTGLSLHAEPPRHHGIQRVRDTPCRRLSLRMTHGAVPIGQACMCDLAPSERAQQLHESWAAAGRGRRDAVADRLGHKSARCLRADRSDRRPTRWRPSLWRRRPSIDRSIDRSTFFLCLFIHVCSLTFLLWQTKRSVAGPAGTQLYNVVVGRTLSPLMQILRPVRRCARRWQRGGTTSTWYRNPGR